MPKRYSLEFLTQIVSEFYELGKVVQKDPFTKESIHVDEDKQLGRTVFFTDSGQHIYSASYRPIVPDSSE